MSDVKYLYNGTLTKEVADWCRDLLQKYPYALEVSQMALHSEFEALYADRTWVSYGEGCMGGLTEMTHTGVPHGFLRKNPNDLNNATAFLFFGDLDDSNRFVERFPELVISQNPFQTQFG